MEHKGYTAAATIGGALFGAYDSALKLLQAPTEYTFHINWAETFQVCWKAGVGALVGLVVKFVWDKIFNRKKNK